MLNSQEACLYSGVSAPTFRSKKVPFTEGVQKGYKLYDLQILDTYFPDAPKILPSTNKKSTKISDIQKMPPFIITEDIQKQFDDLIKIVESNNSELTALDDLVESLLRIRHYKAWYHSQVELKPADQTFTKLLSQSIRDEVLILKALKVSP